MKVKHLAVIGLVVIGFFVVASYRSRGQTTSPLTHQALQWDPSETPGCVYRLKWGQVRGGPYPNYVDVSNTTATASVDVGVWYAVVTALKNGLESPPSNEVGWTNSPKAPANLILVLKTTTTTTIVITNEGPAQVVAVNR